ncbi:MAG: site-specific integrase [Ktedonobacteraceae bacterium]|nr:site-specific integrase [Ktedonobacteraceae bacterium]MBA3914244.1 site-specific integrase [Terriglobales bacterium]
MTLYRRGRIWWAYVWVKGVRHAKSTGSKNRKLAEQIGRQFEDDLTVKRNLLPRFKPETTYEELFADFLANASPKPYHLDRGTVLLSFFGATPIGEINKNSAIAYRTFRHARKTITDTTVNRDLECLRHMLFWAVDEGILSANPLSRMKLVRERRKRRQVMSIEEEKAVIAACSPHLRQIVVTALETGMRRGEILKQRFEDVDYSRRLLYVTSSKTARGEAREIPLTENLHEMLVSIRRSEGIIFTFEGRPIHRIKTAWKGALRRAEVRHYRFHDLRHTFNTRLMEAGVMQEIRKALMGHSSGEEVNSIYTHVELPAKREAIQKLGVWLKCEEEKLQEQQKGGKNESHEHRTGENIDPSQGPVLGLRRTG